MKKSNLKRLVLSILTFIGSIFLLILWIFGFLLSLSFLGAVALLLIIFFPFLPHLPFIQNFALSLYEVECSVLRVLELARFDREIKDGWMTEKEIISGVLLINKGEKISRSLIIFAIDYLCQREAIIKDRVSVQYLKNKYISNSNGLKMAYQLNNDSEYKPRKPKRLPKEKKEEVVGDVVTIYKRTPFCYLI